MAVMLSLEEDTCSGWLMVVLHRGALVPLKPYTTGPSLLPSEQVAAIEPTKPADTEVFVLCMVQEVMFPLQARRNKDLRSSCHSSLGK